MQNRASPIIDAFRKARKSKKLSQMGLSKITGIPQSHISKFETGGVDLRISTLQQLAEAVGLSLVLQAGPHEAKPGGESARPRRGSSPKRP